MYACLYRPPAPEDTANVDALLAIAREFSPRYEQHRDDLVSIDVSGLDRLIGPPRTIGEELRRDAAARGVHLHVALARTRAAALVLALARPGVTIVEPGREHESLASLPIAILERADPSALSLEPLCRRWGIRTLGEFAALPSADLSARLGRRALDWQSIARGEDTAPLVPTRPEERFESSLELEWPVEGLEPLSFVLTRLLEPLSARLERRDRGVAILHLELRLVTHSTSLGADRDRHARHLQLPSPIRDARTLRTLLLLDLESHPPPAAVERVTILIDPTPGRVVQHTLLTTRTSDARATFDAARAVGRLDGAGPHRRAGDRRFAPSWYVPDGALRDGSRRSPQPPSRRRRFGGLCGECRVSIAPLPAGRCRRAR